MRFIPFVSIVTACLFFHRALAVSNLDSALATACLQYLSQYNWNCTSRRGYSCQCKNINWLQSVTYCIHYGSHHEKPIKHAMKNIEARCEASNHLTLNQLQAVYLNGTNYTRMVTRSDLKTSVVGTLIPNATSFNYYLSKFKETTLFVERSQWFGWGLIFYWVAIILIFSLFNINKKIFGLKNIMNANIVKKYITIPSVFKDYRERTFLLFRFFPINFPTRIDAIIITIFVILNILFVATGWDIHLPHPSFSNQWKLTMRMLSYRVDIMALSLFPVIYMFGIRNNPFVAISGISITSFNLYHKWSSYACTVLLLIHSIIWTEWAIRYSTYARYAAREYFQWGIVATILLFLLCFHSEKIFRDRFYETFLFFHKSMNIVLIIGVYYHIRSFGWLWWVRASIGIWAGDRVLRIAWVILNGGLKKARLTDCFNGVIKLSIPKPKFFKYQAGMFVYIYFVGINEPWFYSLQSHPFTILNEPQEDKSNSSNLVIYFKVNKGITKRMLKRLENSGKREINCRVLLEGPYGIQLPHIAPVRRNYTGICAGLGITAVYPELCEIAMKTKETCDFSHHLYWIIHDDCHVEWFSKELNKLQELGCKINVLCTSGGEVDELSKNDLKSTTKLASASISITSTTSEVKNKVQIDYVDGRPDLSMLIQTEIQKSQVQQPLPRDITFLTCGPSSFNDTLRYSMVHSIAKDLIIDVDFDEKSFTW